MFETITAKGFQVALQSHAAAILSVDFPDAVAELEAVLELMSMPIEEIVGSGGGEAKGTQRLRHALAERGWVKTNFTVEKRINGAARASISHEVDHVRTFDKGLVALEIEWNNKDPFFDRDLENFKRLHAEGAISVGVIVTRGKSLQDDMAGLVQRFAEENGIDSIHAVRGLGLNPTKRQVTAIERRIEISGCVFPEAWASVFVSDKFGQATTHWRKLEDRILRGVGNPCPMLMIGIPSSVVTFGEGLDVGAILSGDEAEAIAAEPEGAGE